MSIVQTTQEEMWVTLKKTAYYFLKSLGSFCWQKPLDMYLTNNLKPNNIQFTVIYNKEEQLSSCHRNMAKEMPLEKMK